jgi:ATP-dependent DNA helicase PIF1
MNLHEIDFNDEFAAAFEALENTGRNIFVTGKAGTGKSTLLRYFRLKTQKNIAVLAPTGVSAVNIKGQTIHSFFHFRPDITPESVGDIIVRKAKRQMYGKLETVVIDEISMVRADLLDCVDKFLRLYGPHHDRPFGGVQMIFFGDLFQLPPVVSRDEQSIFQNVYQTPFFFSSKVFVQLDMQIFQLNKIYRQKDEQFIRLLNALRDNTLEPYHFAALNERVQPKPQVAPEDFYITLTTTNALAEKVNLQRSNELPGKANLYQGVISGEFDRKALPTAEYLELKTGAQVMMLNNDQDKRWVNGTLGVVTAIKTENSGEHIIMVELPSGVVVDVKKYTWEISQYYFDEMSQGLGSKVIGYFTQYPLKLAWAVTIHKSQGQTFDRVIIDIGFGTFSHGQIYVALSRCTTLKGLILKQPLNNRHIMLDHRVVDFHRNKITC